MNISECFSFHLILSILVIVKDDQSIVHSVVNSKAAKAGENKSAQKMIVKNK